MTLRSTWWDELTIGICLELGYQTARAISVANGHFLTKKEYLDTPAAFWIRPLSVLTLLQLGHGVGFPIGAPQALPSEPRESRGVLDIAGLRSNRS